MWIALAVVFAHPGGLMVDKCHEDRVRVAHTALQVFLSPSDEVREVQTKLFVEQVLLPRWKKEPLDRTGCLAALVTDASSFADPATLLTALLGQQESPVSAGLVRTAESLLQPPGYLFAPGQPATSIETVCPPSGASLSANPAEMISCWLERRRAEVAVWRDEPASTVVPSQAEWTNWRRMAESHPDRIDRLSAVLETDDPQMLPLREWVLSRVTGSLDPRQWNPLELAAAVRGIRRIDQIFGCPPVFERLPDGGTAINFLGTHATGEKQERIGGNLRRLTPMGIASARRLIWPSCSELSPSSQPDRHRLTDLQHFKGEAVLYTEEWILANVQRTDSAWRHADGIDSIDAAEREMLEHDLASYIERRWFESDAAAPQPDLHAVRSELKRSDPGPWLRKKP